MKRRPKGGQNFLKGKSTKPKHNWTNEGGNRTKMLNMSRQKYFRFDLEDILEKTKNKDNKNTIAATVYNKAAQKSIKAAQEYIAELGEKSVEPEIAKEINRLLDRYGTYR
ncbi:MAG: hypothetical protein ABH950_01055 [Candidatus Altiarchaeota archaeon]